jgi:hypothetical protein
MKLHIPIRISENISIDISDFENGIEREVEALIKDIDPVDKQKVFETLQLHVDLVIDDITNNIVKSVVDSIITSRGITTKINDLIIERVGTRVDRIDDIIDHKINRVADGNIDKRIHQAIYEKTMRLSQKYNIKQMCKDSVDELAKEAM